tara:strand:+ start:293 stop:457 length:165 start_codon:yes stop_codon:yes gene_type:complete
MTELERLQKAVVDAEATYEAAEDAYDVAKADADAANDAWTETEQDLYNYLKEQA